MMCKTDTHKGQLAQPLIKDAFRNSEPKKLCLVKQQSILLTNVHKYAQAEILHIQLQEKKCLKIELKI